MTASESEQKAGKSIVGTSENFIFSDPAKHRNYYDDDECARVVDTLESAKKLCKEIEKLTKTLRREDLKDVIPLIGPLGLTFKVSYDNEMPKFAELDENGGVQRTDGVFKMAIDAGIDMIKAYGLKDIEYVGVGTQLSRQAQYPHQDGSDAYLAFLYYSGNPTLTPTLIRKLKSPSLLITGWYESLSEDMGRIDRKQIEDKTEEIQILGFNTSCEQTLLIDNLRTVHETPKNPKGHIIRFSFRRAAGVPHPDILASVTDKPQGFSKQSEVPIPTSASDWNKAFTDNILKISEDLKLQQKKNDWIWCVFGYTTRGGSQVNQEGFDEFSTLAEYESNYTFWKNVLSIISFRNGYIPDHEKELVMNSLPSLYDLADNSKSFDKKKIKQLLRDINKRHFEGRISLGREFPTRDQFLLKRTVEDSTSTVTRKLKIPVTSTTTDTLLIPSVTRKLKPSVTTVEGTTSNLKDRSTATQQKKSGTLGAEEGGRPPQEVELYSEDHDIDKNRLKFVAMERAKEWDASIMIEFTPHASRLCEDDNECPWAIEENGVINLDSARGVLPVYLLRALKYLVLSEAFKDIEDYRSQNLYMNEGDGVLSERTLRDMCIFALMSAAYLVHDKPALADKITKILGTKSSWDSELYSNKNKIEIGQATGVALWQGEYATVVEKLFALYQILVGNDDETGALFQCALSFTFDGNDRSLVSAFLYGFDYEELEHDSREKFEHMLEVQICPNLTGRNVHEATLKIITTNRDKEFADKILKGGPRVVAMMGEGHVSGVRALLEQHGAKVILKSKRRSGSSRPPFRSIVIVEDTPEDTPENVNYINRKAIGDGWCSFHAVDILLQSCGVEGYQVIPGIGDIPTSLLEVQEMLKRIYYATEPPFEGGRESELHKKFQRLIIQKLRAKDNADKVLTTPELEEYRIPSESYTGNTTAFNYYAEVSKKYRFATLWLGDAWIYQSGEQLEDEYNIYPESVTYATPDLACDFLKEKIGYQCETNILICGHDVTIVLNRETGEFTKPYVWMKDLEEGTEIDFSWIEMTIKAGFGGEDTKVFQLSAASGQNPKFAIFHNSGNHWDVILPQKTTPSTSSDGGSAKSLSPPKTNPTEKETTEKFAFKRKRSPQKELSSKKSSSKQSEIDKKRAEIIGNIDALNTILDDELSEKEKRYRQRQRSILQKQLESITRGKYKSITKGVY